LLKHACKVASAKLKKRTFMTCAAGQPAPRANPIVTVQSVCHLKRSLIQTNDDCWSVNIKSQGCALDVSGGQILKEEIKDKDQLADRL
jgi:hypothetical protein